MPLLALELAVPTEDLERLLRLPALAEARRGRTRTRTMRLLWHDTAEGALAADGLALIKERGRWRLEPLRPDPGVVAPVLAESASREQLPAAGAHAAVLPLIAFEGRCRTVDLEQDGPVGLTLVGGTLRGVAAEEPIARLWLRGPARPVGRLALALAESAGVALPRASLSAEALERARGVVQKPPRLGAPDLGWARSAEQAARTMIAQLADILLHWAPLVRSGGSEPVHQMRVALRRLRSGLALFEPLLACPEHAALLAALKALSAVLGPVRDWDVFLQGTGQALRLCLPEDRAIQRLLAAAERRRVACRQDLAHNLQGAPFRRLGIMLAVLAHGAPWRAGADPELLAALDGPVVPYAAAALRRTLKKLPLNTELDALSEADLHRIRIRAKRLRYATEFFAPFFPGKATRKYAKRLSSLQERLGAVNDGAVAAALMARIGGGGAERAEARGVVRGFVLAHAAVSRPRAARAWERFRALDPFWE